MAAIAIPAARQARQARLDMASKTIEQNTQGLVDLRAENIRIQKMIDEKAPALLPGPPISAMELLQERQDAIAMNNIQIANLELENQEMQAILDESD
jgi:hypothetical protein